MSESSFSQEEVEYPDFDRIVRMCKEKMDEKFHQYGNSWKDQTITDEWWRKRIKGEVSEIFKEKGNVNTSEEVIDAINVLAMYFEKLRYWG